MRREDLSAHLAVCKFRPDDRVPISPVEVDSDYEVMCPYAFLGCQHSCSRNDVEEHIKECKYRYDKRPKSRGGSVHSTTHPPPPTMRERYSMMLLQLSLEILNFASDCKQSEELLHGIVQAALHVVQEASSTDEHLVDTKVCLFGSRAMGLALPESDIDIVVDFMNGKRSDAESLRLVASNLEVGNWLEWIKFIDTATVPVIKLCTYRLSYRSSCRTHMYYTTHRHMVRPTSTENKRRSCTNYGRGTKTCLRNASRAATMYGENRFESRIRRRIHRQNGNRGQGIGPIAT